MNMEIITRQAAESDEQSNHYVRNLNFFSSAPPANDEHKLRIERISTSLFIVLFILSLGIPIFLLIISLKPVTETGTALSPSVEVYSQLQATYSQNLTCACTQISNDYARFLQIQFTLHQVCNSIFVSPNWTSPLVGGTTLFSDDFRMTGRYAFQVLGMFCNQIAATISNGLIEFYSKQYISASVIPLQIFHSQMQSSISQFISLTTSNFLLSLSIIRSATKANVFSQSQPNYTVFGPNNNPACSCDFFSSCLVQSSIFTYPSRQQVFTVPGFYTGCYVIESLLQSTLQCFYDQTCINGLQNYLPSGSLMNAVALDSSQNQYSQNIMINDLLNRLMVEQWSSSISYEKYYNACQPVQCTYPFTTHRDMTYIIIILLGIVGGLFAILKFLVPRMVRCIVGKYKRQIDPVIPIART